MKSRLSSTNFLGLILTIFVAIKLSTSTPHSEDEYWTYRDEILADESSNYIGGNLELSEVEEAANEVLMAAKVAEIEAGFENLGSFLPALNFMSVANDIAQTATFNIIRNLPKGAVLHAHDISFVSAEYVFENITFRDDLYVCLPADGSIGYRFLNSADSDTSCTSSNGWQLLADLRDDEELVDEVNAKIWNSISLVIPDADETYRNVDGVWVVANQIFGSLSQLLTYLPVFEDYYYQGLTELYEDNVLWLELRTTFPTLYDIDGNTYGPTEVAGLYKNTTDRFVYDNPDFVGAKMIYSPLRTATLPELDEYLQIAEDLVTEYSDFVVGFDLVGQEEKGNPLSFYADRLRNISPDVHLFFHAGETQWNGLSTDENLIDAILLHTRRIGHGFAITKHPKVLELVREYDIAIEVNPIANRVGTLVHDMRDHPASYLFAQNFPIVVSCDDPGLWGSRALSFDWYEAFVGIMSKSADIKALKQLAINSIEYSAMSEDEKEWAYTLWEDKWSTFVTDLANSSN